VNRFINLMLAGVYQAYHIEKWMKINIMIMKGWEGGGGARPILCFCSINFYIWFYFKNI